MPAFGSDLINARRCWRAKRRSPSRSGYRDLKPAVVGTCALPGTELAGRYERLLHELRTNWTDARGKQALQAIGVLRQHVDTLEGSLSREIPHLASVLRPARLEDIRSRLGSG